MGGNQHGASHSLQASLDEHGPCRTTHQLCFQFLAPRCPCPPTACQPGRLKQQHLPGSPEAVSPHLAHLKQYLSTWICPALSFATLCQGVPQKARPASRTCSVAWPGAWPFRGALVGFTSAAASPLGQAQRWGRFTHVRMPDAR